MDKKIGEAKRQHIVPKVYLQNFTKKNGKLFKLKIDSVKRPIPKELHPSAVCYKDFFYKFENKSHLDLKEVRDTNILEKRGFLYENKLNKIISKLVNTKSVLTLKEAFELSVALFDIKMRNDRIRNVSLSKDQLNNTFNNLIDEHKKNPESLGPLLQKNSIDFDRFLEIFEEIRSVWISDQSVQKDLHNKYLLDSKINPSQTVKLIINKMLLGEWYVLSTIINDQFITSDNPGYCCDENDNLYNTKFGGIFDFYFPLTPYYLLLIRSPKTDLQYVPAIKSVSRRLAEKDVVGSINRNTILVANKEIYAACNNTLIRAWYALNRPSIISQL